MSDISFNENYVLLPRELRLLKGNCKYCKTKRDFFFPHRTTEKEPFLYKVHVSKIDFLRYHQIFIFQLPVNLDI